MKQLTHLYDIKSYVNNGQRMKCYSFNQLAREYSDFIDSDQQLFLRFTLVSSKSE